MGKDAGVGRERKGVKELELVTSGAFSTDETKRIDHSSPAIKTTSTSAGQREGAKKGTGRCEGGCKGDCEGGARKRRKSGTFSISCLDRIDSPRPLGWGKKKEAEKDEGRDEDPRINPKGNSRFNF